MVKQEARQFWVILCHAFNLAVSHRDYLVHFLYVVPIVFYAEFDKLCFVSRKRFACFLQQGGGISGTSDKGMDCCVDLGRRVSKRKN